jgi:hypothetical protein
MKKMLVVFLLTSASLASAAGPFTCADQPGRRLCGRINQFGGLLADCEGSACYTLWNEQIRHIRVFLDEYYETFLLGDEVGADLAGLANKTARKLCRVRITGQTHTVNTMALAYNRYLLALKQLQEGSNANLKDAYSCTFSEH